jgi:thiol-disulfide isomerase/thioredoxin
VVFVLCLVPWLVQAATGLGERELTLPGGTAIPLKQYRAQGDVLLLWLPSESGVLKAEKQFAQKLAAMGVEVWIADLHAAYFLPVVASSIDKMPARDIAQLIAWTIKTSRKKVYLISSGRGALLTLRGVHQWQTDRPADPKLGGAILLSPKLFVKTPEPGTAGTLMPVISATNLPLFLVQPEKSPWRWKLDQIVPGLEKSGSDVYIRILLNVRDRFYYRPDADSVEDNMAQRLPVMISQAMQLLTSYAGKDRKPGVTAVKAPKVISAKKERKLRAYSGAVTPSLVLRGLDGAAVDLGRLKGKVVLVNFWASWCPPCVHEMPSMQKLKQHFKGRPFRILAVNMAEKPGTVRQFLQQKVSVNFQVLLDSDGAALKRWKVFAFPTSYVVGKQGRIRYALFGAIDWMGQDVIEKIGSLLAE